MGGPTGGPAGAAMVGGGLMGEARGAIEAEEGGRKGELLVKGDASVELGANWETEAGANGEGAAMGLLKAGREAGGGCRTPPSEGLLSVLGRDRGLDRPATHTGQK